MIDSMIILGSLDRHIDYWPVKFIILATKYYIFWCSKNSFTLNIYFLQKEIKRIFTEQRFLAKINQMETKFMKPWLTWTEIFNIE